MNQKVIEIQISFEIAMAIGTSLDLQKMLQTALSAYLRKLMCASGAVLELQAIGADRFAYTPCFCIPRQATDNELYRDILQQLPHGCSQAEIDRFLQSLPRSGAIGTTRHFHLTLLPGFGLLLLIRSGQPLDFRILHSLRQLNVKLADSCIACRQNEQIETINRRLSHETGQRNLAEERLRELLASLERQVHERTRDLAESRMHYKNLFDNIQDIYFSLTAEGRIIEISPSVTTSLHYPRERLLGRSVWFLGFSPAEMKELLDIIDRQGAVQNYHIAIRSWDRTLHHFSLNARQAETPGNRPRQIVGSLRDITEFHLAQQARQQLEEELANSRKMEALGLLAGGVAHDLNNVLSGIVSYPDLLLTMIDEKSSLRLPITVIRDSGAKAAAIVQDLLTMARRSVVQKEVTNLNAIITEYLDSPEHQRLMENHGGIAFETSLEPELLNLEGSPLHLRSAVMNLVYNSVEAGGDRIVIRTENHYVEGSGETGQHLGEGEYVLLSISDNGSGISPEDQARVFEPFYTKKRMGRSGTGLGMAVVWGTVRDHGGHITLDSEPGKLTTFQLLLPASRSPLPVREQREHACELSGQGETVLVVDDNGEQRHIARAALEALGYRVVTAASGEEALARFAAAQDSLPDVVLLDMLMEPGMDGLDTCRQLFASHPGQRIIIVSGYSETDRVKEALALGARLYLRKPYLLSGLGAAVRRALSEP